MMYYIGTHITFPSFSAQHGQFLDLVTLGVSPEKLVELETAGVIVLADEAMMKEHNFVPPVQPQTQPQVQPQAKPEPTSLK